MFQEIEIKNSEIVTNFDFEALIEKTKVDLKVKIERPETLISIGMHPFKNGLYPTSVMTSGEFSCIVAPSKSKKSFLKSAICASYIGGKSNNYFTSIKGHRDKDYDILDIDTEQSSYYSQKTFQRVSEMTGLDYENHKPYKLRALGVDERVALIKHLIYSNDNLKLVFIDGIADLMMDVNDMHKSNEIANYLLKWTEERNIHICVVIHSAFGTTKATGNLGSTLIKKAESVIMLQPTDETKKTIKAIHQYSRGYAFDEFHFSIKDKDALPYQVDDNTHEFIDYKEFLNTEGFKEEKPEFLPTIKQAFDIDDVPF